MKDKYIAKVAEIFDVNEEEVRLYLELDFQDEEEPSFRELVEHMDYQINVCQADDVHAAFLDYAGA